MIVAIDGGVASGKTAVGRRVADALRLPFIDTGLMYRALTLSALQAGIAPDDGDGLTRLAETTEYRVDGDRVWAGGEEMTGEVFDPAVSAAVSRVASVEGVREALVAQQRRLGRDGVVMAGRDIGTVVFPDAGHKFFLVASLPVRVRRRSAQYARRGEAADAEAMTREVAARDQADSERAVSPLRPAPDAVVVDTDDLGLDQVVDLIVRRVRGAPA